MNHAVFCVPPISFESCKEKMLLRAVTMRYIAQIHLSRGTRERSTMVPVRTVNSLSQSRQR